MPSSPVAPEVSAEPSCPTTGGSVTVIVPVRNEERFIAGTLDQLLDQERTGIDLEILVVDGRSTDRTREIVRQYADRCPEVRLLDNPGLLSSSARNIGIESSTGDFLVVIDGHCEIPSRTYYVDMLDAFARSGADCLGRPQPLDARNASPLQQAIAAARSSRLGHHPDSFIYSSDEVDCPAASVAVAYRRRVFDQVGLFDERFDACEDYELNHRVDQARLKCKLVPKLTVRYEPRDSLQGLFYQMLRYGRGRVRLARKSGCGISLKSFAPALLVAGIVLGPLACLAIPALWIAYLTMHSLYVAAVTIAAAAAVTPRFDLRQFLLLLVVFPTIHFGAGSGLLAELLHGVHVASNRAQPASVAAA